MYENNVIIQTEFVRFDLPKWTIDIVATINALPASSGAVDMVFCSNASIVLNNKALVAGMSAEPRRQESEPFASWLKSKGFEVEEMDKMVKLVTLIHVSINV